MRLMMQMINGGLLLCSHYQMARIFSSLYEMYEQRRELEMDVLIMVPTAPKPLPCVGAFLSASSRYFDVLIKSTRASQNQPEGPICLYLNNTEGIEIEKVIFFINFGHVYVTIEELDGFLALCRRYEITCINTDSPVMPIDIYVPPALTSETIVEEEALIPQVSLVEGETPISQSSLVEEEALVPEISLVEEEILIPQTSLVEGETPILQESLVEEETPVLQPSLVEEEPKKDESEKTESPSLVVEEPKKDECEKTESPSLVAEEPKKDESEKTGSDETNVAEGEDVAKKGVVTRPMDPEQINFLEGLGLRRIGSVLPPRKVNTIAHDTRSSTGFRKLTSAYTDYYQYEPIASTSKQSSRSKSGQRSRSTSGRSSQSGKQSSSVSQSDSDRESDPSVSGLNKLSAKRSPPTMQNELDQLEPISSKSGLNRRSGKKRLTMAPKRFDEFMPTPSTSGQRSRSTSGVSSQSGKRSPASMQTDSDNYEPIPSTSGLKSRAGKKRVTTARKRSAKLKPTPSTSGQRSRLSSGVSSMSGKTSPASVQHESDHSEGTPSTGMISRPGKRSPSTSENDSDQVEPTPSTTEKRGRAKSRKTQNDTPANGRKRKYKQYTPEQLQATLRLVILGTIPIEASQKYKVPCRTIYDRLSKLKKDEEAMKKLNPNYKQVQEEEM